MKNKPEPIQEDEKTFFTDEDEADRQERQIHNTNRRRYSTILEEPQWIDNIENAYEDSLSNLDPE